MEHPKKTQSAIEKVRAKYSENKKTVETGAVGFGAGYAAAKGKQILDASSKLRQKISDGIAKATLEGKKAYEGGSKIRQKISSEIGEGKELYKRSMGTPKIKEPIPMRKPEPKFESKFDSTSKTGKKLSFKDGAKAASKVGAKNAAKGLLKSAAKKLPLIGAGIAIGEVGKDVYDYYKGKKAKSEQMMEASKKYKRPAKKTPKKDLRDKPTFEAGR